MFALARDLYALWWGKHALWLGELLFAGWAVCHELGRRWATPVFGSEDVGGAPRWRSFVGLGTSAGALPLLLGASIVRAGGYSAWVSVAGELKAFDRAFGYVFGGLMLADFGQRTMHTPLLKVHHATCLAGHAWCALCAPSGFAGYFAGVVALELGSAATCVHALWPRRLPPPRMLTCMTLSNIAAAAAVWAFCGQAAAEAPTGRWVAALVSLALIAVRQMDATQVWRDYKVAKGR
tara:strand:- start:65 stop:772 length:708 start_codon:yes stop_codon:yes gene_type:complete